MLGLLVGTITRIYSVIAYQIVTLHENTGVQVAVVFLWILFIALILCEAVNKWDEKINPLTNDKDK